ncbi:MAG: CHAD domain-containing protein [Acetobacteraceae bacterium]|nr:CHAD domain-containing protein [Acetobacteraceae bacterium]
MELELRLHPDDAAKVPRLPVITRARSGPARSRRRHMGWHDSPDGELAHASLAVVQDSNGWRLERLVPGVEHWAPGAPPPILARSSDRVSLDAQLPAQMAPAATFVGRETVYPVSVDGSAAAISVLRGAIRVAALERPVCRVSVAGSEAVVRTLSLALAEEMRLEVASASLAADALAAVRGTPPGPRRTGAPRVPDGLTVAETLRFVMGHLTDVILHLAPAAARANSGPEPVHQMRVAVRRLRSALNVFRREVTIAELGAAATALKRLGAQLGSTRNWDVFVTETLPAATAVNAAVGEEPRLRKLAVAAERRRKECQVAVREYLASSAFRRLGIELAWLAGAASWEERAETAAREALQTRLRDFAGSVLRRRASKLLDLATDISAQDTSALHEVRLRAKRLRYAIEILGPLFSEKASRKYAHRLGVLQDRLGVLNDGATAYQLLAEIGGSTGRHAYAGGLVMGATAANCVRTRERITRAWEKFQRLDAFWE